MKKPRPIHLAGSYPILGYRTACGVKIESWDVLDRCRDELDAMTCKRCIAAWNAYVRRSNAGHDHFSSRLVERAP